MYCGFVSCGSNDSLLFLLKAEWCHIPYVVFNAVLVHLDLGEVWMSCFVLDCACLFYVIQLPRLTRGFVSAKYYLGFAALLNLISECKCICCERLCVAFCPAPELCQIKLLAVQLEPGKDGGKAFHS